MLDVCVTSDLRPYGWIIRHIEHWFHFSVLDYVSDAINHHYLMRGVCRAGRKCHRILKALAEVATFPQNYIPVMVKQCEYRLRTSRVNEIV